MIVRKIDGTWMLWTGVNQVFTRIDTAATLTRSNGQVETVEVEPYEVEVRISASVAEGWSDEQLAVYGLKRPVPFTAPEGKQKVGARWFEEIDGVVYEMFDVEDLPPPPPPPTAREKVGAMLSPHGLSIDELRQVLADETLIGGNGNDAEEGGD